MAETKITDIIIPAVWTPYTQELLKTKITLVTSGIMVMDPMLDALATAGGKTINIPFFNDLTGSDEVLSDSGSLTAGKIDTAQQVAVLLQRGRAFGANELAGSLAGADPMAAIAGLVTGYWARRIQIIVMNVLTGVFAENIDDDSSTLVNDISTEDVTGDPATAANYISADAVIDTQALLGDEQEVFTDIIMHSVVYTRLKANDLIDFEKESGNPKRMPLYMDLRVHIDDGVFNEGGTTSGTKYSTYICRPGALGLGNGLAKTPIETDRNSLAGVDYLITRKHLIVHPGGFNFQSNTIAGETPTNAELAEIDQWSPVSESVKQTGVVCLITNG